MAQTIVRYCDYMVRGRKECGEQVEDNLPTTFQMDGVMYEGDLCGTHKAAFVQAVHSYLNVAQPVAVKGSNGAVRKAIRGHKGQPFTIKDVRVWLREQGEDVPDSGRLPKASIDRYVEAHSA